MLINKIANDNGYDLSFVNNIYKKFLKMKNKETKLFEINDKRNKRYNLYIHQR